MKSDNGYGKKKSGGTPPFFLSREILDADDREYFDRCAVMPNAEMETLMCDVGEFYSDTSVRLSGAREKKKYYFERLCELREIIARHSTSLHGDAALWRTVKDDDEKKKTVKEFYDFCGSVSKASEELSASVEAVFTYAEYGGEEKLEMLKKRIFICGLAGCDVTCEHIADAEKALSELCALRDEMYERHMQIQNALGELLLSLDSALDVKGKGKNMNITAAVKAENAFVSLIV